MWEERWDMECNPSKWQVLRKTISRNLNDTVHTLHVNVLEIVTIAKYIGLISLVAFPGTRTESNAYAKIRN